MILLQVSGLNYGLIEDYFPLIISNILVLLFFLFFQSNKQKADTAYKSHIAELEARSLRAQMNPHFIYNALNSVQSVMILKGERESNRYIGMLSKLLRFTLEMSTKESITLEEEIDYLDSYLGLQKMRLDSKMEYDFKVQLNQNIKEYTFPPMLVQPIVENSILHGISSLKDRTGKVTVRFMEDKEFIKVTVEDNGIGIKASLQNLIAATLSSTEVPSLENKNIERRSLKWILTKINTVQSAVRKE